MEKRVLSITDIRKKSIWIFIVCLVLAFTLGTGLVMSAESDSNNDGNNVIHTEITFGDSIARQIPQIHDEPQPPPAQDERMPFEIRNSRIKDWNHYLRHGDGNFFHHSTVEEARLHASFPVREPAYLPDGTMFGYVRTGGYDEQNVYEANISYDIILPEGSIWICLWQAYIGPDAYIDIEQTAEMEKILIGDVEAVLVERRLGSIADGKDDRLIWREMIWVADDTAFILYSSAFYSQRAAYIDSDLEMLINIAESIK